MVAKRRLTNHFKNVNSFRAVLPKRATPRYRVLYPLLWNPSHEQELRSIDGENCRPEKPEVSLQK